MGYIVKKADIVKDKSQILKFWKDNRDTSLDEKYTWMYENNPYGKAHVWLILHDQSGEIVGMSSLFPKAIYVNGNSCKAGIAGDFIVNVKHRSFGPALKLQRNIVSQYSECDFDFIYGFPNQSAKPVMRLAGCNELGQTIRLVKILKTKEYLEKNGMPAFMSLTISPILDLVLRTISKEAWFRPKASCRFQNLNAYDARFDRFWKKHDKNNKICAGRSSAYLNWKYNQDPDDDHRGIAIVEHGATEIKGYMIYCYRSDTLTIRDFALPTDHGECCALMKEICRVAKQNKAKSIEVCFLENAELIKFFKAFNFINRSNDRSVIIHANKSQEDSELIKDKQNWFLVISDQDT